MKKSMVLFSLIMIITTACGCLSMMYHDSQMAGLPTYRELAATWDPLTEGHGRIIVLYPKRPFMGAHITFDRIDFYGIITVELDGEYNVNILDNTFVFADVPPGKHNIRYFKGSSSKYKKFDVDVRPGETVYVQVRPTQYTAPIPDTVLEEEALKMLEDMRHAMYDDLPFNI